MKDGDEGDPGKNKSPKKKLDMLSSVIVNYITKDRSFKENEP
jgi:hypothetical protein